MSGALRRIAAMVLRYWYLLRGSWSRLFDLMFWPSIMMVLWGFISTFLATNSSWVARASGVLLAAVMLWDVLFRGELGFSISFLEEIWSRNLGHLFVSPLRPGELMVALMCISLIRTLIGVLPALAVAIPLFAFNIFDLGLPLIAFFFNLMATGWALGAMVTGLILLVGMGAENIAWFVVFLLAPIACIYYPIGVLPEWLQWVALAFPMAYVFEGMRAAMFEGVFRLDLVAEAAALNALYLAIGIALFFHAFRRARITGALFQTGE
jgi:ABC-2 type transport system permease protein